MKGIDQIATREHSGFFAWPTALMAYALGIGLVAALTLTYLEYIPLWLCGVINFVLCYLAFTPLHEAVHNNVRGPHKKWAWVEYSVGHLTGIMLLGPFPCFAFLHLTHHAHTNDNNEDPDAWVAGKSAWAIFWRCLTIMPHYYHFFFTSKKRAAQRLFLATILGLVMMICMLAVLMYFTSPQLFIVGWIVPALLANGALAFFLDYLPHVPHNTMERYKNTNVVFGRLIYWVTMAHSYHVVHHLWPRIPFYRYKKAFYAYRSAIEKKGTPIFASLSHLLQTAKH